MNLFWHIVNFFAFGFYKKSYSLNSFDINFNCIVYYDTFFDDYDSLGVVSLLVSSSVVLQLRDEEAKQFLLNL